MCYNFVEGLDLSRHINSSKHMLFDYVKQNGNYVLSMSPCKCVIYEDADTWWIICFPLYLTVQKPTSLGVLQTKENGIIYNCCHYRIFVF